MPGWRGRLTVLVLFLAVTVGAPDCVLAQARAARASTAAAAASISASGTMTFGFARQPAELPERSPRPPSCRAARRFHPPQRRSSK